MAVTIDRTNYNALVDDDGTNTKGTPWSKNQVKIVLMDPIDAALAKVMPVGGGVTGVVFGPQPPGLQTPAAVAQFNISSVNPFIWNSIDAATLANDHVWDVIAQPLSLSFRAVKDGYAAAASNWMIVTRTTGNWGIANVNFPSAVVVGGLLTVNGAGQHIFLANSGNGNMLTVRNTGGMSNSYASLVVGNDANATLLQMIAYSSTYAGTAEAFNAPNSGSVVGSGVGGLSLIAGQGSVRIHTGGSYAVRMMIANNGDLSLGSFVFGSSFVVYPYGGTLNLGAVGSGFAAILIFNNSTGQCGTITVNGATTTYNTSSDARLKIDQGRATNLEALRAVVVHDFQWKADDRWDRGVFAQEAESVFPRAVAKGTDDRTDEGRLKSPWMTDYSKFVPDLIVGFQQHDAAIAALRAELLALKG